MKFFEKVADLIESEKPSYDDIERAFHYLRGRLIDARRKNDDKVLMQVSIGSLVVVKQEHHSHRLPAGALGRIKKFNSKTITVDFGAWREWRIPASFVEPAPKGAKVSKPVKPLFGRVSDTEIDPEIEAARRGLV